MATRASTSPEAAARGSRRRTRPDPPAPSMSTGLRVEACSERSCPSRSGSQLRQLEAVRLAGVGAQDGRSAELVTMPTRRPAGRHWQPSSAPRSKLAQRIGPDHRSAEATHPSPPRTTRPPRRCGTRRRGRRQSARRVTRRSACAGRGGARCARSCAGSRTTQGRAAARRSNRLPPSTRGRRWPRCRAGSRSRRTRKARGRARRPVRSGRAPLRSGTTAPRGPAVPRWARGRVDRPARSHHPETVRPHEAHPGCTADREQLVLQDGSLGPASANPADTTSSARTPRTTHSRATVGTLAAGTATMASSGASGSSATEP